MKYKYTANTQLTNISKMSQNETTLDESNKPFSNSDKINFKFVLITSCDVESVFPQYKNILAESGRKFMLENLLHNVNVKCNNKCKYLY